MKGRSLEGAKVTREEEKEEEEGSSNGFDATRMVDRQIPGQREEGGTEGGGKRGEERGGEAMA